MEYNSNRFPKIIHQIWIGPKKDRKNGWIHGN